MAAKKRAAAPRPPAKKTAAPRKRRSPYSERGTDTPAPKTETEKGTEAPTQDVPRPPSRRERVTTATQQRGAELLHPAQASYTVTSYHRWVMAEFVASMLLAFIGFIVTPRRRTDGTLTFAGLLVQMTAIMAVFLVLALATAGRKSGKIAAAFGLLVMLGVLLNSTDAIKALGTMFAPPKKKKGK